MLLIWRKKNQSCWKIKKITNPINTRKKQRWRWKKFIYTFFSIFYNIIVEKFKYEWILTLFPNHKRFSFSSYAMGFKFKFYSLHIPQLLFLRLLFLIHRQTNKSNINWHLSYSQKTVRELVHTRHSFQLLNNDYNFSHYLYFFSRKWYAMRRWFVKIDKKNVKIKLFSICQRMYTVKNFDWIFII